MKKAILTVLLFLVVGLVTEAEPRITRQVVGTGGFLNLQTPAGKMSGIFGQSIIGKLNPTIGNAESTMYVGFWSPALYETGIEEDIATAKGIYNFPNPVSGTTVFKFVLKEPSYVTISVYNNLGELVANVVNEQMMSEGQQDVQWDINSVANNKEVSSGAYTYEMHATPAVSSSHAATVSFRNILMISK